MTLRTAKLRILQQAKHKQFIETKDFLRGLLGDVVGLRQFELRLAVFAQEIE
jgi:hypothetical protein